MTTKATAAERAAARLEKGMSHADYKRIIDEEYAKATPTPHDEFGNAHFETGIPMGDFQCNHVRCPTWRILTNPKGRVELYGAGDGVPGVAVLWDSLDAKAPNKTTLEVMQQLAGLRDAINLLFDAVAKYQLKTAAALVEVEQEG
jgi:hypothetical protein